MPRPTIKKPFQLTPKNPEKNCWKAWNEMFTKLLKFLGFK